MEPATRTDRLKAALVDFGLVFAISLGGRLRPFGLIFGIVCLFVLLGLEIYQWVLLTRHGQTIGKRISNIRIIKIDVRDNGGFVANVVLRTWIGQGLLCLIPLYALADILFIFRDDRRCIHDFIAGTRVVRMESSARANG